MPLELDALVVAPFEVIERRRNPERGNQEIVN